jgi:exodeoxyribonuclease-3
MKIRIATWNVNSLNVRLGHVLQWLETHPVDILALQETKLIDTKFPHAAINEAGYQVTYCGQKTYNGVAVLSRDGGVDVVTDIPNLDDPARRVLAITVGKIRLLNLYVPNGQSVGSDKYAYKLDWLEKLIAYTEQQLQAYEYVALVGDFNIAPQAEDVHDPTAWEGQVLCSEPEREAFQHLLQLGLVDTFRLFPQADKSYSWWDYRQLAFRRNAGLRIDHILASQALAENCTGCVIDKTPRKWERPSDHAPVIAEFTID